MADVPYIAVGANSQSFGNTASLVTCVKNFPESRGMLVGLLKGFIGIIGAAAWLPSAVCIVFVRTMRILTDGMRKLEVRVLFSFLCISLALAGYLMVMIIVQKRVAF